MISANPAAGEDPTNALVLQYLPLVGYAVQSFVGRIPCHVEQEDLAAAGQYALVKAARAYDASTGVPFARYAQLRIRGALLDELRSMDWVPRQTRTLAKAMTVLQDQMTGTLGRRPTRDELAAALNVRRDQVDDAYDALLNRILSLDAYDSEAQENLSVDRADGPDARTLARERYNYLIAGVQVLPARLRTVIEGSFFADRSDVEMAAEAGVTQSRISQMRSEAFRLLREGMHASLDPDLCSPVTAPGSLQDRRRQAYAASLASQAALNALPTQRSRTAVSMTPLHLVDVAA